MISDSHEIESSISEISQLMFTFERHLAQDQEKIEHLSMGTDSSLNNIEMANKELLQRKNNSNGLNWMQKILIFVFLIAAFAVLFLDLINP